MTSIFQNYSFSENMRLTWALGHKNPQTTSLDEIIIAARQAIIENPKTWVLYIFLGDKLLTNGDYAEALHICQKGVELKPNDVRSAYALATCFNLLTRASFTKEEMAKIHEWVEKARQMGDIIDPEISQRELNKLGIDVHTAALRAKQWFEYSLSLTNDSDSLKMIKADLESIHRRFPNLK